jgi:hypothetical protein
MKTVTQEMSEQPLSVIDDLRIANTTLEKRLAHIEDTLMAHDGALRDIYEKIRPLQLPPPEPPKRRIGFITEPE